MQQQYITTFLGITPDDIEDFITIRHRFDNPLQYRLSMNEITDIITNHETELKMQEDKYLCLTKERENISKEIEEIKQSKLLNKIIDQSEKFISFPYQSFLILRYWRKPPKNLKIFFQALACFFSISNHDFLTELKVNHNFIQSVEFYQPSSIVIDEFRMKYLNLKEISPEYIRNKSFDCFMIAIWMYNIEENERLNRIKQTEIENEKRLENKLNEFYIDLSNKQKDSQLIQHKIQSLKKNLDQIEIHRQVLLQSN